MIDELKLREVAERYQRLENGERGKVVYGFAKTADDRIEECDYGHIEAMRNNDARLLARHYLATREGEEEAYGKWLRSIGGVRPMATASDEVYAFGDYRKFSDSFGCYPVMFRRHKKGGWTACVYGQDQLMPTTTRGQVLALLKALGISTKEHSRQ